MKKSLRIGASVLLIVTILLTLPSMQVTKAAIELPKSLRVGLYYKDSYLNTSVASFLVSAEKGISLGTERNGSFIEMIKHAEASALYVRKDTYFIRATLKEYNPLSIPLPDGEKLGPYHVKIGNDYSDMGSAIAAADLLKQSGIITYIAFADAWQVWTGFFIDAVTTQSYIDQTLKPIVGEGVCTLIEPKSTSTVISKADGSTILIYASSISPMQIVPLIENNPSILKLDKSQYRGKLEVRRLLGSDMTVINIISIGDYLRGSVPAEIGGKSPLEALKAQTVAAKMFAINSRGKHTKQSFDICNADHCQVYKGYNVETAQVNDAVEAVKDKVITYNGKVASAIYYFSSSGGFTESNENVWGTPYPYLVSVEDKYETGKTWNANWTKIIKAIDIKKQMPDLGDILGISILTKSPAGRATTLEVRGSIKQNQYTKDKCRTVLGLSSQLYNITTDADITILGSSDSKSRTQIGTRSILTASGLKTINLNTTGNGTGNGNDNSNTNGNTSTNGNINSSIRKVSIIGAGGVTKLIPAVPETYTFTGKGWGHAIGMSQSGAIGMAAAGFTYDQILMHYFKGTKIE